MNGKFRPRWWHWLAGVIMPVFTIGFEMRTHQFSGTLFDPMTTPWHAMLLAGLPAGCAWLLGSAIGGESKCGIPSFIIAACLPYYLLMVVGIGALHWIALLKLAFGLASVVVEPTNWRRTLFGDYSVSPIAGAACFGPLAGCTMGGWILLRSFSPATPSRSKQLVFVAAPLVGGLAVVALEGHADHLRIQILNASRELRTAGEVKDRRSLLNAAARAKIARLGHPGQQYSSAGSLYAVGPVDVFGPWSYITTGRPHPADSAIRRRSSDFADLHKFLWPDEPIHPSSWRGLSPWEQY